MDRLRFLTTPLALFGVLLVALPLMELAGAAWPAQPGNAEWRFGAIGLLSSTLLQPMLGSVTLTLLATLRGMNWLGGTMCVLNAVVAVLLLLALPIFALDSLELRGRLAAEATLAFDVAAIKALLLHAFALLTLAALSRGGFRSMRAPTHG